MLVKYKKYPLLDIREGDIILYRTEFNWKTPITYISAAIRLFTQCKYNHSAVVTNNNGILHITEALTKIVTRPLVDSLQRGPDKIMILRRIFVPEDCSKKALSKVGSDYDLKTLLIYQLLYRLPKLLVGRYGKWFGPTGEAAADKVVCSELCGYAHSLPEFWSMASSDFIGYPGFKIVYQEPLD